MQQPLVSYVVVTHDRDPQQVCDRIIDSIACQTYHRKELVLIGESCDHIDDFRDQLAALSGFERVHLENLPRPDDPMCVWALVARARNHGISLANGSYICCQDDDNQLVPHFTREMLRSMDEDGAVAAWCWRTLVEPDGAPYTGRYFPWIENDEVRRRILFDIWTAAGVIVPGESVVRDTLWAPRGSERFSTVDPNEWLVHRDVFRLVPYRERYTHNQICYHITFDDIWDADFSCSGLPVTCWRSPGLIYHLGGASNSHPPSP